jgi:hypothetical protein
MQMELSLLFRLPDGPKSTSLIAEGAISFNPQPTARNLNKPARLLRTGSKGSRKLVSK